MPCASLRPIVRFYISPIEAARKSPNAGSFLCDLRSLLLLPQHWLAAHSRLGQPLTMLLQLAQDIPLPPGAASNIDVQQRLQQLPQMTDTPEAFAASLQTMRSLAELNQDVAAYLNGVGTLTPEIEAEINSMYSEWGKGK